MTEHSAIERYIEALETKDFKALGDLFTSDGHYCDYCPNGTPQHEYHRKGQILRSTSNTAPLTCGACNTQPEGLLTMA